MVMLRLVMNLITIALLLGSAFLIYYVSDMSVQVCSIDVLNSFFECVASLFNSIKQFINMNLAFLEKFFFFIFIQF